MLTVKATGCDKAYLSGDGGRIGRGKLEGSGGGGGGGVAAGGWGGFGRAKRVA